MKITITGNNLGKFLAKYFNDRDYELINPEWTFNYGDVLFETIDNLSIAAMNNDLKVELFNDYNRKIFDSESETYI